MLSRSLLCDGREVELAQDAGPIKQRDALDAGMDLELVTDVLDVRGATPVSAGSRYVTSAAVSVSRILLGSIGIPGPIVVETVRLLTYLPLAADGLALRISSTAVK
jgi:hypothetical protein